MDEADRAQQVEERHRERALAAHRERPRPPGQTHCLHCAEPISEARRRAVPDARLCIDCQRDADRQQRWRST